MDQSIGKKRLRFSQGCNYFRQRLALSLLSSRPVKIEEIRAQLNGFDLNIGVTPYEVSFIHLLDSLSNGTKFKINETGTEVSLTPGVLIGGTVNHSCDASRPISYYLEPVLLLAPFCKKPLHLTLKGRLHNDRVGYSSIYKIKHAALPIMDKFGLELDLQVKSKGYNDAEIVFKCTVKKQLLTLRSQYCEDAGKVKKIRGLAFGYRVPPQLLNRIISSAKGEFLPLLSDVYIGIDAVKNSKSKLPGYGLILYAETTKGIVYAVDDFVGKDAETEENSTPAVVQTRRLDSIQGSGDNSKKSKFDLFADGEEKTPDQDHNDNSDKVSTKRTLEEVKSPEELGLKVAKMLIKEIATQSRIDSSYQFLIVGLMALSPRDVSSVVFGPITPFTVQFLRDLKTFFGVTFKVEKYTTKSQTAGDDDDDEEENEVVPSSHSDLYKLTCLGSGYINLNKTTV